MLDKQLCPRASAAAKGCRSELPTGAGLGFLWDVANGWLWSHVSVLEQPRRVTGCSTCLHCPCLAWGKLSSTQPSFQQCFLLYAVHVPPGLGQEGMCCPSWLPPLLGETSTPCSYSVWEPEVSDSILAHLLPP